MTSRFLILVIKITVGPLKEKRSQKMELVEGDEFPSEYIDFKVIGSISK